MQNKEMIRFCPKCGSTNVKLTRLIADVVIADFKFFECFDCKWRGIPLEGTKEFIEKFKKNLMAKKGEKFE